jgi:hypothetical protein
MADAFCIRAEVRTDCAEFGNKRLMDVRSSSCHASTSESTGVLVVHDEADSSDQLRSVDT